MGRRPAVQCSGCGGPIAWDGSMFSQAHISPSQTKAPGGERGLGTDRGREPRRSPEGKSEHSSTQPRGGTCHAWRRNKRVGRGDGCTPGGGPRSLSGRPCDSSVNWVCPCCQQIVRAGRARCVVGWSKFPATTPCHAKSRALGVGPLASFFCQERKKDSTTPLIQILKQLHISI